MKKQFKQHRTILTAQICHQIFRQTNQIDAGNSGSIAKEICAVWRKRCKKLCGQGASRELCGVAFTLILCILLSLAAIFAFTACSGSNNQTGGGTDTSQQDTAGGTDADGENAGTGTDTGDGDADNSGALTPSDWGKVLIVYYSRTGNTEAVADTIHSLLPDADLFEVERAEPYPDGYTETTEVAQEELQSNARPALADDLTAEEFAGYDTILFGFPIWWGQAPMSMFTFLDNHADDLEGMNLVTFCTAASSPISGSTQMIRDNAHGATVYEGERFSRSDEADIRTWLEELGLLA